MIFPKVSNIIIFLCLIPCISSTQPEWIRQSKRVNKLGTLIGMTVVAKDSSTGKRALQTANDLIDSLNLIFSDYDPRSEVHKINSDRRKHLIAVSPLLYDLIVQSLMIADQSEGRFDPTLGNLTQLWRTYKEKNRKPPKGKIRRAKKRCGYQLITLEAEGMLRFTHRRLKLDFGGIAKGYIADRIAERFRSLGLNSYLIDMGGDFLLGKPPPGEEGWVIQSPVCSEAILLSDVAIGVSGARFQFLIDRNISFSHILSSDRPSGVKHGMETYVLAQTALLADAWATALNVTENSWYPSELIIKDHGFFIHKTDHTFVIHFTQKVKPQLNSCR